MNTSNVERQRRVNLCFRLCFCQVRSGVPTVATPRGVDDPALCAQLLGPAAPGGPSCQHEGRHTPCRTRALAPRLGRRGPSPAAAAAHAPAAPTCRWHKERRVTQRCTHVAGWCACHNKHMHATVAGRQHRPVSRGTLCAPAASGRGNKTAQRAPGWPGRVASCKVFPPQGPGSLWAWHSRAQWGARGSLEMAGSGLPPLLPGCPALGTTT